MNEGVIKFLKTKGYKNIYSDYYKTYIEMWEEWFKNDLDGFHSYYDFYKKKREMYSLGMAKKVCEDWASIIYSERDEITTDNEANKEYVKTLVKMFNLTSAIPNCIEKSAWSGTCGAVVRVKRAKLENSMLTKGDETTMELITVNAKQVIPLRIEHGKVIDCAFVSEDVIDNKKVDYIELHQLQKDGYVISNIYLNNKGVQVTNEAVLNNFKTNSFEPLFSLLMPPKDNFIENNNGLGLSIYANAIDQLKGCDITYHNFMMDFYLGGKKLIYNKKLVKYKTVTRTINGTETITEVPEYPDDISKQQFMEVGDETTLDDEKKLLYEYNPSLRVADNKDGIQFSLDLLSLKVGFGVKYYQFNGTTIVTATQYSGERQDLVINAKKYRDNLSEFVGNIIKAGLLMGRLVFKENVTENCNVMIDNVDGFMVDDEAIKQSSREDLALGIISKLEYRMIVFHETEKEAKRQLALLDEENTIKKVEVIDENPGNNNNR